MTGFRDGRLLLVLGGLASSVVLLGFGIALIAIGIVGRQDVRSTLAQENIIGPADSAIPGLLVDNGSRARAMADVMREHTLERTGGLTYAEMGRFESPDGEPRGTNDAAAAVKDADGQPVSNAARELWVSETALATALNTAYFAEQVGSFVIVMGVALVLTGIGFAVLTLGALWRRNTAEERMAEARAARVAAGQPI